MGNEFSGIRVADPPEDAPPRPIDVAVWRKRNDSYTKFLEGVRKVVDDSVEANECPKAEMRDFEMVTVLGWGGFGKVFKVKHNRDGKLLAMKVQEKRTFQKPQLIERVILEKKLHFAVDLQFIAAALYAFQDREHLFLVLPYAEKGDLSNLTEGKKVTEKCVKYMAAQMILAIEYLHAAQIMHRDLKPWNILLFDDFYLKVTDLGQATRVKERAFSVVGSPTYHAPEVKNSRGYGKVIDWYALGVILHELMYNELPVRRDFPGGDGRDGTHGIMADRTLTVNKFIMGLLMDDPEARLGQGGAKDVKSHFWFIDINFYDVIDRRIRFEGNLETYELPVTSDHRRLYNISQVLPPENPFEDF